MFIKIKRLSSGVKASIAFFVASLVTKGIGYITMPIYTRLLSPEDYGKVSIFLTWLEVFGIIAMFCLSYGVFNNGMIDYPEKRAEFSLSMLGLSNLITICFMGIIFLIYPKIDKWIKLDYPLVILMFFIYMSQPAYNFWTARQRYEYKYKGVVLWTIICSILSPSIAIFAILYNRNGNKLYSRLFGAEIPLILIYLGFYIYLFIKGKFRIERKYWKSAFFFNLPLIPHYLSTYLLGSADKLMISNLVSESATAFYSVAYSVASIALIVWSAINSSLIPYTYNCCREKKYDSINKVTLPILIVFAVVCLGVILLAPEVISIAATKSYWEAIYVIPPVVGGVFFQVQYFIYANIVYYYKKPKYVMYGSITAVILNLILNYVFIPKYGYIAAGFTTLFSYLLQAIIDYFAMKKAVRQNIYNMRIIAILSLIVISISLLSGLLYQIPIVRYFIISIFIIFSFTKRNIFKNIFLDLYK